MSQTYFAVTAPGLEPALLEELRQMKIKRPEVLHGGVEFEATSRGFYEALCWVRTAHRLYLRVDEFRARENKELYRKARRFDWSRLIPQDARVHVRGVLRHSKLGGSGELIDAVADGLRDHFTIDEASAPPTITRHHEGGAPEADPDEVLVVMARSEEDRCQLNLEAGGAAMHVRGWRQEAGPAPLRESLAAAALLLAGWSPSEALLDPMCGAGTIPVEAARWAAGLPPRQREHHAAARWANWRPERWEQVLALDHGAPEKARGPIWGRDVDGEVLGMARRNAARGEVDGFVRFAQGDVAELEPPQGVDPGLVLCNPPYGERLEGREVVEVLLERFAQAFEGWRLAMVLPRDVSVSHPTLSTRALADFSNGGIPVRLWLCARPEQLSE